MIHALKQRLNHLSPYELKKEKQDVRSDALQRPLQNWSKYSKIWYLLVTYTR
jgi:hypothetical protein